jgi:hypothetical protein
VLAVAVAVVWLASYLEAQQVARRRLTDAAGMLTELCCCVAAGRSDCPYNTQ